MRLKSMLARVRVNGECSASLWYLTSEKRLLSAIKGRVVLFFFQKEIWQLFRNENFLLSSLYKVCCKRRTSSVQSI